MVQIGKINTLRVQRREGSDVCLDGGELGPVLLPEKYVPEQCREGDEIKVFVYVDREGQLLASTQGPYATVGQFVKLRVVTNTSAGSFVHWGMENDLLVPKSEQLSPMEEGKSYVVFVFLSEKTHRITASSRLDRFLSLQTPTYVEGEEVDLLLFDKTDLGYRAVINQAHVGMIYANEVFQELSIGQHLKGYIKKIRDDLKIDLSLQQSGYQKVDDVSRNILEILEENGGKVAVTDKSPPDEIYRLFGVSKKVFKKAIGALYKKRIITIDLDGIKLANEDT